METAVAVLFCIGNLLNSRQQKSLFDVVKEERSRTITSLLLFDQGLSGFFGFGACHMQARLRENKYLFRLSEISCVMHVHAVGIRNVVLGNQLDAHPSRNRNRHLITCSFDLFSLSGLLLHFRPCDDTLENSCFLIFK